MEDEIASSGKGDPSITRPEVRRLAANHKKEFTISSRRFQRTIRLTPEVIIRMVNMVPKAIESSRAIGYNGRDELGCSAVSGLGSFRVRVSSFSRGRRGPAAMIRRLAIIAGWRK
jgi:hypothetical protein